MYTDYFDAELEYTVYWEAAYANTTELNCRELGKKL